MYDQKTTVSSVSKSTFASEPEKKTGNKPSASSVCVRNSKTIFLMFCTNENLSGRLTIGARCTKKGIFLLRRHVVKTGGSRCYQASVSVYMDHTGRVHFHSAFRIVVFLCCQIPIILNILILEEPK